MLQLQEYVLWRLRDTPGQRTLSAFQQQPGTTSQAAIKPTSIAAALPPSPYKQYAAAAAQTHRQPDMPVVSAAYSSGSFALPVDSDTSQARVASAADTYMLLNTDRGSMQPDWPQLNNSATVASSAADQPLSTLGQFAGSSSHLQPINKPAATDQHRPMHPDPPPPPAPASATSPPTNPPGVSDDYKTAYEVAAAARAACDLLRGPPKSSRDDPHFMDSYYKSSRLSFIGRWKARIEALTASMAADAPLPQVAHQPLGLMHAFRQGKGDHQAVILFS